MASEESASLRRPAVAERAHRFVGVTQPEQRRLVEVPPHELEADGQSACRQTAGHRQAGCPVRLIGRVQRVSQARTSSVTPSTETSRSSMRGAGIGVVGNQEGVHAA